MAIYRPRSIYGERGSLLTEGIYEDASIFGSSIGTYADKIMSYGPIAYWPLWETSGVTAVSLVSSPGMDGAYSSDVSTWPVGTGIGDGNTAPHFDGANDYVNLPEGALDGVWDGDEGTMFAWAKLDAGFWTDGISHTICWLRNAAVDWAFIQKDSVNNFVQWSRRGNLVVKSLTSAGHTTLGWFTIAFTWSVSGDIQRYYIYGAEVLPSSAGLNAWTPASNFDGDYCVIGNARISTRVSSWPGYIAHVALFATPLAPAAITDLNTV